MTNETKPKMNKPNPKMTMFFWMIVTLMVVLFMFNLKNSKAIPIEFPTFLNAVKTNQIETVTVEGSTFTGKFKDVEVNGTKIPGQMFQTYGSISDVYLKILEDNKVVPQFRPPSETGSFLMSLFFFFGPILLIYWFIMRSRKNGPGGIFSFTKMDKMVKPNQSKVTFNDVAGIDDIKQEISEIKDFLKNPEKYRQMGAAIPKGVLLVGPPGTGKTMLAKAIANEAGVPFFSASGSEFVEMFVGVGASRVRALFDQAKANAPCIIFIDEIDAIAKSRGGVGAIGGHDEREQTLNQILTAMQGFEENPGIIVIGATNRPEVLDPAILRPGRFDRKIYVSAPDLVGREAILKSHARNRKMAPDIDFKRLARATAGMTGADLENLLNEAALMATRVGKESVGMEIIEEARDKILMGVERKTLVMKDEDKHKTAVHEAGHALVTLALQLNQLHKVSIIPRGHALGVTQTTAEENEVSLDTKKAKATLSMLMGGRAAEELIFGHFSSGASNDLKRATMIARKMICEWGMSEKFGAISFSQSENGLENNLVSETTMREIDEEIQKILTESYESTKSILTTNRVALDIISDMLVKKETCTGDEIVDAIKDKLTKEI